VEEVAAASYLGFPRALNAAREWRRVAVFRRRRPTRWRHRAVPEWRAPETDCAAVYGDVREAAAHVRDLHPALDAWMVIDGYGKVLSRPGLDLERRELCVVAACAAMGQDRQLHSHLHGALNVGVHPDVIIASIEAVAELIGAERARSARLLLARVLGK
jgi:4-carboxymuconolactone decarboxylase